MRPQFLRDIRQKHRETVETAMRFAVIACVAAIAIIAVGAALRTDVADGPVVPAITTNAPLAADLARCRDITAEELAADDNCRRVWAENRRRFFAPTKPAEAR